MVRLFGRAEKKRVNESETREPSVVNGAQSRVLRLAAAQSATLDAVKTVSFIEKQPEIPKVSIKKV